MILVRKDPVIVSLAESTTLGAAIDARVDNDVLVAGLRVTCNEHVFTGVHVHSATTNLVHMTLPAAYSVYHTASCNKTRVRYDKQHPAVEKADAYAPR